MTSGFRGFTTELRAAFRVARHLEIPAVEFDRRRYAPMPKKRGGGGSVARHDIRPVAVITRYGEVIPNVLTERRAFLYPGMFAIAPDGLRVTRWAQRRRRSIARSAMQNRISA
jgi:hypothetical protein